MHALFEEDSWSMYKEFGVYVDEIEGLFRQLKNSELRSADDLRNIPDKGIYVLYENSKPIYVGRSNRISKRLTQHGRGYSDHNSATFAFKLAKETATERQIDVNKTRAELVKDPKFSKVFGQAKQRVAKMRFRLIPIEDQVSQTLFEVYAILKLRTFKYNDFVTH